MSSPPQPKSDSGASVDCVAVIAAAGHSQRMGCDKLLLPWGTTSVVGQLLATFATAGVRRTLVVIRPEAQELAEEIERCGGEVLKAVPAPIDMKDSLGRGLGQLELQRSPPTHALLSPADVPTLRSGDVATLLQQLAEKPETLFLQPVYQGHPGHPLVMAREAWAWRHQIPQDRGFDWLVQHRGPQRVLLPGRRPVDMDTPQEYRQLREGPDADSAAS